MGAAIGVVASVVTGGGAGGMLGGLLGGGGLLGNLLSGIFGGGAGGADAIGKAIQGFSPANVLNAAANLVNANNGNAVKESASRLHKEEGMPKFIQDAINQAVDKILKQNEKPTDACCQQQLGDATKDGLKKEFDDLVKKLLDNVRKQLGEESKDATGEASGSGQGGKSKKPAGSWLMAIARAMGEVLGEKAGKMVELSDKVSAAAQEQKGAGKDEEAKSAAAADMTAAQTELQGVSQEYKLLTESINTVVKGIGEALSNLGRKQ